MRALVPPQSDWTVTTYPGRPLDISDIEEYATRRVQGNLHTAAEKVFLPLAKKWQLVIPTPLIAAEKL